VLSRNSSAHQSALRAVSRVLDTRNWAYKYIEYCAAESIVDGYDPVTCGPTITVSRDQMAVFICRAFGLPM
jgi:hypothetical protein